MKKFKDVVDAWNFLRQHPYYAIPYKYEDQWYFCEGFEVALSIEYVRINPITNTIEDDAKLNTQNNIWLESGHWWIETDLIASSQHGHDTTLDLGAKSFEKAIIKLAKLVYKEYGNLNVYDYFDRSESNLNKWNKVINGDHGKKK